MRIAEVKVAKTTCETTPLVPIPKGIVGAVVSIEYTDPAWDGLQKTVVFRSAVTRDVLAAGNEAVVPAEVVSRAGVNLYMGVYGVGADGRMVIPTIWTELGLVHGAAAPSGDTSTDPSLPVWAQIQAMIGNLDNLDTAAKSNLVAAINEALTKGGGEVDPATVQKIVEDYAVSGDTFRDKCVHFAVGTCGMSLADINAYRAAMINGTPETLHWYQSITKNLTGCTISNAASQVDYGESYTGTLTPESGKTLTSVVIKMGGVDITSTAYSAGSGAINIAKVTGAITITAAASAPSVTYTITRNLTNCASSNAADSIAEGAAYITTLSPTGTYKKLGAITVTMGGTDISASAVSGSTITISSVTGDITITCAAVITNIIDAVGISANTRLSAASGANKAQEGHAAIGANMDASSLIHLHAGDTLRIKGVSIPAANDGTSVAVRYSATATFLSADYMYNGRTWGNLHFASSGDLITITSTAELYIRLSPICTDAPAVIATINEEIS